MTKVKRVGLWRALRLLQKRSIEQARVVKWAIALQTHTNRPIELMAHSSCPHPYLRNAETLLDNFRF
ncbi:MULTISPECIES: hypothetical protein [unclassified Microcoleus]|uniref:hypothetical protein n=1 Tax=unclassified Microcoleus TaxID=2642155 RepID=UPI002FD5987F